MGTMVISPPSLVVDRQVARVATDLVLPDETRHLWFECDASHADKLSSETCDGFLIAALAIAMRSGLNIRVEGQLSSRLYYYIKSYYMELLLHLLPNAQKLHLNPAR